MRSGIDIGYDNTKVVASTWEASVREFSMRSVVGTPDRSHFSANGLDKAVILEDADGSWSVGDKATHSRFAFRREDALWWRSGEYSRLMAASLGLITDASQVKILAVVGLPVAYYSTGKQELKEMWQQAHQVKFYGRTPQRITIEEVRVIPQPFGTFFDLVMDDDGKVVNTELAEGPVGIIDIGSGTTNFLSARGLADEPTETTSIDAGMWDVVRAVREELNRMYADHGRSDFEIMDMIIKDPVIRYNGQKLDISDLINREVANLGRTITGQASTLWGKTSQKMIQVVVTGGGAYRLTPLVKELYPHTTMARDPHMANARGYHKFAVRCSKR